MATAAQYEALGAQALRELADLEHAFVIPEAEAKIADQRWGKLPSTVDPNHISTALRRLIDVNELVETTAPTRGRRQIKVIHRPITHGSARAIADASSRKRLLQARYVSWATGSKTGGNGAIGPGLETVLHTSLQAAAPYGYRLLNPSAASGEVRELFGKPVAGGTIDHGAWLTRLDPATFMPESAAFLMLVEAKNLRQWIYPRTQELHQLLAKTSAIQLAHPDLRMLPVLVCRRAHYLTTVMAEHLGFYVIQTRRQYVRPFLAETELGRRHLAEVNDELAYNLEPEGGPVEPMVKHFRVTLQSVAQRTAERWAVSAPLMADTFATLRDDSLRYAERAAAMDELAELAEVGHGAGSVRWHGFTPEP